MKKGGCIRPEARSAIMTPNFFLTKREKSGPRSIARYRHFGIIYRWNQLLRRPSGDRDAPQRNVDVASNTEIRLLAVGGATGTSHESAGRELSDLTSVRVHAEETRLAAALGIAGEQDVAVGAGGDKVSEERCRPRRSSARCRSLDRSFRY